MAVISELERLSAAIRRCRICVDEPMGRPLPHEPRPVFRLSATARMAIVSQAPGTRVHASGVPFSDASGDRLRAWLGVSPEEFYDVGRVAIVPMGFCFPGHDAKGGDLPPRRECAQAWRARVFRELPHLKLVVIAGFYGLRWHLGTDARSSLAETVRDWRRILARPGLPKVIALPHPSWRNNGWLRTNPWFERELLPELRKRVRAVLAKNAEKGVVRSGRRAAAGLSRGRAG